jgi:hypothetical protein
VISRLEALDLLSSGAGDIESKEKDDFDSLIPSGKVSLVC